MLKKTPADMTHLSELPRRQTIPVLSGVMLGILLSALDQTIVGMAVPRVAHLQGLDRYAWVFTAYMLASTASMPMGSGWAPPWCFLRSSSRTRWSTG